MKQGDLTKAAGSINLGSADSLEKFRKPLMEYLVSNLEHPDRWVQYLAVDILGALGDDGAIEYLIPLAASGDQDLRNAAFRSLKRLGDFRFELQKDGPACNSCLIRSIAEEALGQLRVKRPARI